MTNKLKHFIGNWKMFGNFGSFKIVDKVNRFVNIYEKNHKIKIVLCVPNTLIYFFNKNLKVKKISIGAQNCHHNEVAGPFTGSINANMLKKIGTEYIILGHSENRAEGETNKLIKKKISSALNQKINIIFCIGENLKEKNNGFTFSVLKKQLSSSLTNKINFKKIIVAYEPIWSIGTNKIPKLKELTKIIKFIKSECKKIYKSKNPPEVLYGGSVNPKNISSFSLIKDIDGFLIGGASQSSKKFIDIVKNYYK
jgi:triosephosphate isomerase (TIM)